MKRIISAIIVLAIMLQLFPSTIAFADATPTIGVATAYGKLGDTVTVSVAISNNTSFSSGNFEIQYDSNKLKIVSASPGSLISSMTPTINTGYAEDSVKVTWAGLYSVSDPQGELCNLTFEVISDNTSEAVVAVKNSRLYNFDLDSITHNCIDGKVVIEQDTTQNLILDVASLEGEQGEVVTIDVNMGKASNVCSGNFAVEYDNTKLQIVSATAGTLIQAMSPSINTGFSENSVKVTWAGLNPITEAGAICHISFMVKEDAVCGVTDVKISNSKLYDLDLNSLNHSTDKGIITILEKSLPIELFVNGGNVNRGENVTVSIDVSENSNMYGGNATIEYDTTAFELVNSEIGDVIKNSSPILNTAYQGNKIRVVWAGTSPITNGGTLCKLTFKANNTVYCDGYEICITSSNLYDENSERINYNVSNGYIAVNCEGTDEGGKEWSIRTEPTCTTDGLKYRICEACGKEAISVVPRLGHKFSDNWTVDVAATCASVGSKSHHCLRCDVKSDITIIHALGHIYTEWKVKNEPTCTEYGLEYKTCNRESCNYEETNVLAKLEHSYSAEWTIDKKATCTKAGSKSHHCLRCESKADVTVIEAYGHSFEDWIVDIEASILSTGEKHRECNNCDYIEKEDIPKIEVDLSDANYGFAHFKVVDAITLEPVEGAEIYVTTDNDGEAVFIADENGMVSQILPVGKVNISVTAKDYQLRNIRINVKPGEQIVPDIGIGTQSLVDAELTSEVMTIEEIIAAGIDVTAPGNRHIVKYNIKLNFNAGIDVKSIMAFFNDNGDLLGAGIGDGITIPSCGGGNGTGGSVGGTGGSSTEEEKNRLHYVIDGICVEHVDLPESGEYILDYVPVEVDGYTFDGWYADILYTTHVTSVECAKNVKVYGRRKGEKNNAAEGIVSGGQGDGIVLDLSDGTTATVYPISENFYMIIQGEAKWLKEMFDVQLLVINNSNTDTMENVEATLTLPEGLSLATMRSEVGQQAETIKLPSIPSAVGSEPATETVHWYVRGDKEGSYDINAKLTGKMMPFEDEFEYNYVANSPIKVYAGSALRMNISAPDSAFNGEPYPIKIELENVSDRTLYGVTHTVKNYTQGKVTEYSDGEEKTTTYIDRDTSNTVHSAQFKPGDKMTIEIESDVLFESEIIKKKLEEITDTVDGLEDLSNTYKAVERAGNVLSSMTSFLGAVSSALDKAFEHSELYAPEKAKAVTEMLDATAELTDSFVKGSKEKDLITIDKIKNSGVDDIFDDVVFNIDFYSLMSTNEIFDAASKIKAIARSAKEKEEYNAFDSLNSVISSIPIRYSLEDVVVTTLNGSTTEIPYTVSTHKVGAKYFGVDSLGRYMYHKGMTFLGKIQGPLPIRVLGYGKDITGYEKALEYVKAVENEISRFSAYDTTGDTEFKAWVEKSASSVALLSDTTEIADNFNLSVTNDTAVMENGVLTFTGEGVIEVTPAGMEQGTLYIQANDEIIKTFVLDVVEAHECHSNKWFTVIQPSEDIEGYRVQYCDVCDDIIGIESVECCIHHSYGNYILDTAATEEVYGIKYRVCKDCGYKDYKFITDISGNDCIYEGYVISIKESDVYVDNAVLNGNVKFEIQSDSNDVNANLITAVYDNGVMLKVQTQSVEFDKGDMEISVELENVELSTAKNPVLKFMLWLHDSMVPLCPIEKLVL